MITLCEFCFPDFGKVEVLTIKASFACANCASITHPRHVFREDPRITGCRDACGARVADEKAAEEAGWTRLAVAGGWRCGNCVRICLEAGAIVGMQDEGFVDHLPATSRGALPKETASTIAKPAVRP